MERRDEGAAPGADIARVAGWIAIGVAAVSVVGIVVALVGRPGVVVDLEHPIPVRAGAALACLLLALALLGRLGRVRIGTTGRLTLLATAGLVATSSMLTVSAQGLRELGRVFGDTTLQVHGVPLLSAACVALLGLALLGRELGWAIAVTDTLACVSLAISTFVLFAWGIGNPDAISIGAEKPPLFLGAAAFGALAVAIIASEPDRDGLGALLARRGPGAGSVLRRFVPVALLVPLGLEVARHQLVSAFDVDLVVTLQVFATAMLLVAIVVFGALRIDRAERELRAAREAAFMSTLSHELRTPLIAIRNLAEVVEQSWDEVADDQKREANRATLQQSTRMLDLLHDTWQLRRLDAGTLPAQARDVALLEAMRAAVNERGLQVVAIDCPAGLRVWMDPEHLRLMLGACLRLAQRSGPGPKVLRGRARDHDACVYVEVPSRPGVVSAPPAESSWSLWTIAQLARRWGGEASFERIDDARSQFVVTLPIAARLPT